MKTNYDSHESFLRTASGQEEDALNAFLDMDDFCGQDLIDREDDLRLGCVINARLNAGYAGSTREELEVLGHDSIDAEIEYAEATRWMTTRRA